MGTYVIVAGVDGSDGGRRALDWAVREAGARGGTVQAVTAWRWDLPDGGIGGPPGGDGDLRDRAERVLANETAEVATGVPVAGRVMEGRPAEVLAAAARDADLLVVGSHGHSRAWRTVLGSVAEECARIANRPVVVIPVPHEAPAPASPPAARADRTAGGGQSA